MKKIILYITLALAHISALIVAFALVIGVLYVGWTSGAWVLKRIFPTPLTNQEVIQQTKLCEDNNLEAGTVRSPLTMEIIRIQCQPK